MTTEVNPFLPPQTLDDGNRVATDFLPYFHWLIVFGLNLIVPGLFGWSISEQAGRQGILLASAILLLYGWGWCFVKPEFAKLMNLGSLIVALSQLVPVVQIVIGAIGIWIAGRLGSLVPFNRDNDAQPLLPRLTTEFGGLVVAFFVGASLIACATFIAMFIALGRPKSAVQTETN